MTTIAEARARIPSVKFRGTLRTNVFLPGTVPKPMSSAAIRRSVQFLFDNGEAYHTLLGTTLWASIEFLHGTNCPYTLEFRPDVGYMIKLVAEKPA